jgi:hypothetical protein
LRLVDKVKNNCDVCKRFRKSPSWVLGKGIGQGIPEIFVFNSGGEFNNADVLDLAEKHGIEIHGTTSAHSPFGNSLCETNHKVVDKMMAKLMADDKTLKPDDALHDAFFLPKMLNQTTMDSHHFKLFKEIILASLVLLIALMSGPILKR